MDQLARVIAAPASLEARRQLAAAWETAGDPRGAFVRAQVEYWQLASVGKDATPPAQAARTRAGDLLRGNRKQWAGEIAKLVEDYEFHRGLVAEITMSVDAFVERAKEIVALAPIQHLNLTTPATRWNELVALPQLDQIVSLEIAGAGDAIGDKEAIALSRSPHTRGLRWVGLSGNAIGRLGVEALAASPHLARVVFLGLRDNMCDPTPHVWNDGGIAFSEPNPIGTELQRTHGPRPWLAGPPPDRATYWPPDRDEHAAH